MLDSIVDALQQYDYNVVAHSNAIDAIQAFNRELFDLVISDIKMPGMSGIELLEKIFSINQEVPFIIMTAFGDVAIAVEAMKKGAYDFIEKGNELLNKLEYAVKRALRHRSLLDENLLLKNALQCKWKYIGKTSAIEAIRELINKIAKSRSTVLISGESGTGKELIARSIHYLSKRQNGPFIKINCAALPDGLIESELFGHEKGAFTGALKTRAGKFELASGGTLLLDEIAEMSITVQAKLLRVLQEREINKVGGDNAVEVDVRIIATTNKNLEEYIKLDKFREDLFYRLNVFHITLPPLRERMSDLPHLVQHFIEKYNDENGFSVSGIDSNALKTLEAHYWPGNIRELENAIERAVVLTRSGVIKTGILELNTSSNTQNGGLIPGMTVAEAEKVLILNTLKFCNQNRTKTAEMLSISIRTLRNKLNEYGMS
jgi:DNA-binding NtrC family response regulator